jgi:hypothetical protein
MLKAVLTFSLVSAAVLPSAFALPTVRFSDGPGNTGGGEFNAVTSANGSFITFCLEYNEHISFGTTYYYNVSGSARFGGNNTLDPLSRGAAWLYLHLLAGDLAGYDHSTAQANLFQRAIWFLEGESAGQNNSYVTAAINANGGTLALAQADNNGFYGVGVMNLWANPDGTGASQDQLIRIPDGGSIVAIFGLVMTGLGLFHRRFRKA